jgi:hypothetical protein
MLLPAPGRSSTNEWLAEAFRQVLRQEPRQDVADTAGAVTDEDAHRPRRIGFRQSAPRDRGHRQCACRDSEEASPGKLHEPNCPMILPST